MHLISFISAIHLSKHTHQSYVSKKEDTTPNPLYIKKRVKIGNLPIYRQLFGFGLWFSSPRPNPK